MDLIALVIAERFLDGSMPYWPANDRMSELWQLMLDSGEIPDFAYAVFSAFDEGEFDHRDGTDPVIAYTVPQLHSALRGREDG